MKGRRIQPPPVSAGESITRLVEDHFLAYNAGRLREAAGLLAKKMLAGPSTTVGLSLTLALAGAATEPVGASSNVVRHRKIRIGHGRWSARPNRMTPPQGEPRW